MKKRCLSILAVAGLVSASFAFAAENNVLNGYYSAQHPLATVAAAKAPLTAAKAAMLAPTNITTINASSNPIYAVVPNSPIYDIVYSTTNDHIRNGTYYLDTLIALKDPNQNQFWIGSVCRYAIVTVYGTPGNYKTNVDSDLCK